MQHYSVKTSDDGQVLVTCGGKSRTWAPDAAKRHAMYLSSGATLAREQQRGVTPGRYGLPGDERLPPAAAYHLAHLIWCAAASIHREEAESETRIKLGTIRLEDTEADEPTVVRIAN